MRYDTATCWLLSAPFSASPPHSGRLKAIISETNMPRIINIFLFIAVPPAAMTADFCRRDYPLISSNHSKNTLPALFPVFAEQISSYL